ncbi:fibronectin type III domain-containing protein [Flavobacterium sp. XS1P32]|uniref:fibronectin type III domain-containing protein n=1 Tax=unclassified Flavobacterium TaxID=196869 RepID=UPI003AB078AE
MKKSLIILVQVLFTFVVNEAHCQSGAIQEPPTDFKISTNVTNYYNSTTVSWTGAPNSVNVKSYQIYIRRSTESTWVAIDQSCASTARSYTLTSNQLPPPMNYQICITAQPLNGIESARSNVISYEANQGANSPLLDNLTTGTNVTPEGFLVSWAGNQEINSNTVGYYIFANEVIVGFTSNTSY